MNKTEIETKQEHDDVVACFLRTHKREIADNGFSRHVMRHLPDNRYLLWSIALYLVGGSIGIYLFNRLNIKEKLIELLQSLLELVSKFQHLDISNLPISVILIVVVLPIPYFLAEES